VKNVERLNTHKSVFCQNLHSRLLFTSSTFTAWTIEWTFTCLEKSILAPGHPRARGKCTKHTLGWPNPTPCHTLRQVKARGGLEIIVYGRWAMTSLCKLRHLNKALEFMWPHLGRAFWTARHLADSLWGIPLLSSSHHCSHPFCWKCSLPSLLQCQ